MTNQISQILEKQDERKALELTPGLELENKLSEGDLVIVGSAVEIVTSFKAPFLNTIYRFRPTTIVRRKIVLEESSRVPREYNNFNNKTDSYDRNSKDSLEKELYQAANKYLKELRIRKK